MTFLKDYVGTVVRVEREGFGIIKFDSPLGANTHGVFSTSLGSTMPVHILRTGERVHGTAEVDARDLAAVKTIETY